MANISGLNNAIRQPYVRVTGTSYPDGYTGKNNTAAQLLPALQRFNIIGDSVRVVTQASSNGPIGVSIATDGSTTVNDTPYDLDETDYDLKLAACGAALPLNDLRVLNDGSFDVNKFYKTFLGDAIRARAEELLIVGDSTNPDEFDGLENFPNMQTQASDNTNAATRIASIEVMADLCARGRGVTRCDAIVMPTAARRKLRKDCRETDNGWKEDSEGHAMVSLAQGWTSIIDSDFVTFAGDLTSMFGLVLKGENACAWATPKGMERVVFSAARDPQKAQEWIIGEMLGTLIIQDTTKAAQLTGYDAS